MSFWQGMTQRGRIGLVGGAIAIVLATAVSGWWLLHTEYQALFTELKPQDAQAMTTELERLKIPYHLGDSGTSILVDKATVHATRIKLMGKDLPLHGAVGLELFNNTDFGMTEFAQKINYQRALQGELTRTIQSLTEVKEVRVLLALPEQGLFKQATSKAKASITVTLRQGQALRGEQVTGIQRLVAAAVPGMTIQGVTIVDSHGVALTRSDADDGEAGLQSARLDLKRDTEGYLARKAATVLDRTFGAGQALASVDVTLNMDQIRTTTEDVLPAPSRAGLQAAGVVVRERETLRDPGASADRRATDASGSSQRDLEYAVGRRIEQVVSQPGSIRRIQVVAVVRQALDAAQEERLRKVIAAAVGASPERGDTVVIQSLAGAAVPGFDASTAGDVGPAQADASSTGGAERPSALRRSGDLSLTQWVIGCVMAMLLLALVARAALRRSPMRASRYTATSLSEAERAVALRRVQDWMGADDVSRRRVPPRAGAALGTMTDARRPV
ncbi:flagellar basal-body MS-ring/collar protein FliF [Variovorax ginsengisoli]|uniref:Flagellar M-ring protein n=1 Tax=Variovorax ginsengisoli TaxID=363844 RepID=A0ABT8SG69_9BURK|nr:flagellar basal-body MS-ring/collar protein FliF [Variovorax ginsengisoli]MDN8618012.1 flagellar basal-body MS-ring/collar protein FliF [Variovorax ginsengisoli]MDO1537182.1 flagellar basal-body MS-ring/collar protein FliF [Variovorax ginsengisoli]